jgi:ABC-type molybdate transport system substrate-binding protein
MSEDLVIFAPGSMSELLPRLIEAYVPLDTLKTQFVFGPSGSLRAKIEKGNTAHLFLSACDSHTKALFADKHLVDHAIFGENRMVLLHQRTLDVTQSTALEFLANQKLTLGASTTGLDPQDDYAFQVLRKISHASNMPLESLERRTRVITGGRENPNAPVGRNQYGWIMETQHLDLLLTLHTNACQAVSDNQQITFCELPEELQVICSFGIGLTSNPHPDSSPLYTWLQSMNAHQILIDAGFSVPIARLDESPQGQ